MLKSELVTSVTGPVEPFGGSLSAEIESIY